MRVERAIEVNRESSRAIFKDLNKLPGHSESTVEAYAGGQCLHPYLPINKHLPGTKVSFPNKYSVQPPINDGDRVVVVIQIVNESLFKWQTLEVVC
jgi:hypothetical protein